MNYSQTWGQRMREQKRTERRENIADGIVCVAFVFIMCLALVA